MQKKHRRTIPTLDIPEKANRVLNFILLGMVLILVRAWHLSVIQHDQRVAEASKPQIRVVIEPAKRGTIRDRFNNPLAINKVQYNAAIMYSQIKQIPSIVWEKRDGKRVKIYKRRDHITKLSELLGKELGLKSDRIEDLIHAKASFYNSIPFVIKEDITEEEYYRLKMLEKDWLGIHTELLPKRFYPKGNSGADLIGYMGAISSQEYESVIGEIKALETLLSDWESGEEIELPLDIKSAEEAKKRLDDLIEHAYTINDYVGKAGVEGSFEQELRGFHGKKKYFSDARGNYLKELEGSRSPVSGRRVVLSISAELQEFSEKLLIQMEEIRKSRLSRAPSKIRKMLEDKEPWIKGGAIVAIDPKNGEILSMASHPRMNPNDFISTGNLELKRMKNENIHRWFESESYIGAIWDQKQPMERELCDPKTENCYTEKVFLNWDAYLSIILPPISPVRSALMQMDSLQNSVKFQRGIKDLMKANQQDDIYLLMKKLSQIPDDLKILESIPRNDDKVLFVDLIRLAIDETLVTDHFMRYAGKQSLSSYHDTSASVLKIEDVVQAMSRELFDELTFKLWREQNQKAFLKEMRLKEKMSGKKYASPYIDLIDGKQRELFQQFWSLYREELLTAFLTGKGEENLAYLRPYFDHFITWKKELMIGAHTSLPWYEAFENLQIAFKKMDRETIKDYIKTVRPFQELNRPLLGRYPRLRKEKGQQFEKHLAAAFYPLYGYGYGRSYAFRQAATQGSVFKLVTSYAALMQRHLESANLILPEMYDNHFKQGNKVFVGFDINKKPIPQLYKGGLLPKTSKSDIGKIDLIKALEVSSNPYFALLAGDFLHGPEDLIKAASQFSYGKKTGIDLPAEFSGRLPQDLGTNRTGLYATAIGQHSMVVTPLQTAVMLSAIANGGKVLKPKLVKFIAGETPKRGTSGEMVTAIPTCISQEIEMPEGVRHLLLKGMKRVMESVHENSFRSLSAMFKEYPGAISDYLEIKDDMVGKSGTAESMEFTDLGGEHGTNMYNHIWFGGIVFDKQATSETFTFKDQYGVPEIVVVVYLRYGTWGRDAVPIAAEVAQKWREIKKTATFSESL